MYLLFLDESGTPDDGIFALGGVAVRADCWGDVRSSWNSCLESEKWPLDKELKWADTNTSMPADLTDAVYQCITELPIVCFTTVLYTSISGYDKFFATPETTYATAVTFIAERYQRFLANQDSYGAIVLDSRRREKDDQMRKFFGLIQREGTAFAELDRIVDGLLLGPSHFSLGLQIADFVVGPARASQIKGLGEASRRHKQLVNSVYARHPASGEVDGVGLKFFPDSTRPNQIPDVRLFNPRETS